MSLDPSLRAQAQASQDALDYLLAAVNGFYSERPYQHVLGEESRKSSFALLEIDKMRGPTGPVAADPVFIIGNWRSGTTLLSWLFDSHPRFAAVPENQLLMSLCGAAAINREPYRAQLLPLVWAYQSVQFLAEER